MGRWEEVERMARGEGGKEGRGRMRVLEEIIRGCLEGIGEGGVESGVESGVGGGVSGVPVWRTSGYIHARHYFTQFLLTSLPSTTFLTALTHLSPPPFVYFLLDSLSRRNLPVPGEVYARAIGWEEGDGRGRTMAVAIKAAARREGGRGGRGECVLVQGTDEEEECRPPPPATADPRTITTAHGNHDDNNNNHDDTDADSGLIATTRNTPTTTTTTTQQLPPWESLYTMSPSDFESAFAPVRLNYDRTSVVSSPGTSSSSSSGTGTASSYVPPVVVRVGVRRGEERVIRSAEERIREMLVREKGRWRRRGEC